MAITTLEIQEVHTCTRMPHPMVYTWNGVDRVPIIIVTPSVIELPFVDREQGVRPLNGVFIPFEGHIHFGRDILWTKLASFSDPLMLEIADWCAVANRNLGRRPTRADRFALEQYSS